MQKRTPRRVILIFILGLLVPLLSFSQSLLQPLQGGGNKAAEDTTKALVQAIPLAEINSASTEAFQLFARVRNARMQPAEKVGIAREVDSVYARVRDFLQDTSYYQLELLTFREQENLNTSLQLLDQEIADVLATIRSNLSETQEAAGLINRSKKRWQLTSEKVTRQNSPEAIQRRVQNILRRSDSINLLLQSDIDFLLTQADRITDQQIGLEQFEMDLEAFKSLSGSQILRRDAAPIWVRLGTGERDVFSQYLDQVIADFRQDTQLVLSKYTGNLFGAFVLFVVLLILVFWIRGHLTEKNLKARAARFNLYLREIFLMPVEVALILTLYLTRLMIPDLPNSYRAILSILSIYPIIRISIDILPSKFNRYLLEFTAAYLLMRVLNVVYDQTLLSRLMLLLTQALAGFFLVRFLVENRKLLRRSDTFGGSLIKFAGIAAGVMLGLSLIGNLVGIYGLSEYITSGIIQSSFLVLTTYVGFHVSAALVYLLLSSALLKKSNLIRDQFRYIFRRLYHLLKVLFVFSWFYITLYYFNAREAFTEGIITFLNRPLQIGKVEDLTLMSIVLFIFVIWLAMFISRIARYVLQDEVFTRVEVKKGMPGTIIMLVRIAIVSIGFMLAAAAAGMELSNLTIILGAFSVGIGFGLQNIFNNLVSGLILVFERPIKEGDTVEVNTLLGEVKRIGIRSSIVRTYDGAEVIVPNGTLISNELINWTLSDAHRRLDIRAGVAYGTDPERVLKILLDAANENDRAMKDPEPRAFFIGFGDSSLNFRLLVWSDLEHRLQLESELKVAINRKLKEAAIEIPFPQRDLHIRSVDPKAGTDFRGQ
ncbi:MAG: mechanosensitive ion channel [Bacteroidales bacterium]|nr:mechanosensitive ion channel [Bacteroidales bacterium]MDT8432643.1 mechanosensitive ion channel [Bacteroidales bacterium]